MFPQKLHSHFTTKPSKITLALSLSISLFLSLLLLAEVDGGRHDSRNSVTSLAPQYFVRFGPEFSFRCRRHLSSTAAIASPRAQQRAQLHRWVALPIPPVAVRLTREASAYAGTPPVSLSCCRRLFLLQLLPQCWLSRFFFSLFC